MSNDGAPGFPHFVTLSCDPIPMEDQFKACLPWDLDASPNNNPNWRYTPTVTLTDVKMVNPNRPELRPWSTDGWRCINCRTVYAPHVDKCTCCTLPVTK